MDITFEVVFDDGSSQTETLRWRGGQLPDRQKVINGLKLTARVKDVTVTPTGSFRVESTATEKERLSNMHELLCRMEGVGFQTKRQAIVQRGLRAA